MKTNTTTCPVPPTVDHARALEQLEEWVASTETSVRDASAAFMRNKCDYNLYTVAKARRQLATAERSLEHYRASNPA